MCGTSCASIHVKDSHWEADLDGMERAASLPGLAVPYLEVVDTTKLPMP